VPGPTSSAGAGRPAAREIIWLGGALWRRQGTNSPFILRERGIVALPIVTSDPFNAPEMRRIKDSGVLVGDPTSSACCSSACSNASTTGVIVDGFPARARPGRRA
jgi:hypothetical protein